MTVLADHTLLLALPAFAPAVVVVGVVVFVAMRDRRNGAGNNDAGNNDGKTSDDGSHSENSAPGDHDGSP
ncbi:MAG: hypothetical protein JWR34_5981 [Mycobacterium sp.]|nr:hypothetical protein [Mycobacterium sp.]